MGLTYVLSLALLISMVSSRAVQKSENVVPAGEQQFEPLVESTVEPDTTEIDYELEVESSSYTSLDKISDHHKNISSHSNTVIIVYVLVVATIIVKTAPNVIYYLLPKVAKEETDKEGENGEKCEVIVVETKEEEEKEKEKEEEKKEKDPNPNEIPDYNIV